MNDSATIDVLVCDPNLREHRERLSELVGDVATCHFIDDPQSTEALGILENAPIYVGTRFTTTMGQRADNLQLVLVGGAGYDGIDLAALPSGVSVANTFNHEASIGEYAVAAAVMVRRGIVAQHDRLREGIWSSSVYDPAIAQPHNLQGARLGLLGYGHIGKAVWQGFRAMGASGRAIRRSASATTPDGLEWIGTADDLDTLLDESDILVVCMPLDDSTRGIIGAEQLRRLGTRGILINVGRGPLVDPDALFEALTAGVIAGAAIDVWYDYPDAAGHGQPSPRPFGELPNVLLTPHISGVTHETFAARVGDIAENIHNHCAGRPIDRVVHVKP